MVILHSLFGNRTRADRDGVAINLQGDGNIIQINADAARYLSLMEAAQRREDALLKKNEQLEVKNAQLEAERAALANRLARDTQSGQDHPLADRAVASLEHGNLKPTADYLRDQAQQALAQGIAANAQAAEAMRQLAAISTTAEAVKALQRATEYEPDNMLNWWLLGDMQRQAGKLPQAESAYRTMLRLTAVASQAQPSENSLLRNLSVSHEKIGDIQKAQGDLAGALLSYRAGLTIRQRLAQHDAANTLWQRDLSISHNNIGDIQQAQGDLAGALLSYHAGHAIFERLAQHDAANTEWQRDLSISHEKIGNIQQAQGDLAVALLSYRASLTIRERLAKLDLTNFQWQTDLILICFKLCQFQDKGVSKEEVNAWFSLMLATAKPLIKKNFRQLLKQDIRVLWRNFKFWKKTLANGPS